MLAEIFPYVAQIGTVGTLQTKQTIKDVIRVFEVPFGFANDLTKLIMGTDTIEDVENNVEFMKRFHSLPFVGADSNFVWSAIKRLNGLQKSRGRHAGGILVSDIPIDEVVPCWSDSDGSNLTTEVDMHVVEDIKFVKYDFLGVRTLGIIKACERDTGVTFHSIVSELDEDEDVYMNIFDNGNTVGVFQAESLGFAEMMSNLKPRTLDDVALGVALYRPSGLDNKLDDGRSAMEHIIARRNGQERTVYMFEEEKEYLSDTNGLPIYQEQLMKMIRQLTGCTLGRADITRRIIAKKKLDKIDEEMAWLREKANEHIFTDSNNINDTLWRGSVIEQNVQTLLAFGRYGFGQAHSVDYGALCYATAYYKHHFPAVFYIHTLNSLKNNPDRMMATIKDARDNGIKIVPPDINKSNKDWTIIDDTTISFGLSAIKGVDKACEPILLERRMRGNYKSVTEFVLRVHKGQANKTVIKNLAKAGAFDNIFPLRCTLVESIDNLSKMRDNRQKTYKRKSGDYTPTVEENLELLTKDDKKIHWTVINTEESDYKKAIFEQEVLQHFITCNPLDSYAKEIERYNPSDNPYADDDNGEHFIGIITKIHEVTQKNGKKMCFLTVLGRKEEAEFVLFADIYKDSFEHIEKNGIVVVRYKKQERDGKTSLIGEYVRTIKTKGVREVTEVYFYPTAEEDLFSWIDIAESLIVDGLTDLYFDCKHLLLKAGKPIVLNDKTIELLECYGVISYHRK